MRSKAGRESISKSGLLTPTFYQTRLNIQVSRIELPTNMAIPAGHPCTHFES